MFIRTPAIPCEETLSKPLSISFASSVHSDIQLVEFLLLFDVTC